jgi:membrane protein YqaA with SNARE-associated domain
MGYIKNGKPKLANMRVGNKSMLAYGSLFLSSLLSATLLPGSSEILLISLLLAGHDGVLLWLSATLGNSLGSAVNWVLGRYLLHFSERRWFPMTPAQIQRAQQRFQRHGVWVLLLAWLPIIGDPLTLVAGMMRVRWWVFISFVAVGKGLRYAALVFITG